ncbi:uncharacterized protein C8Q71DRAFT_907950 [Rhodofomes roseus]|uniref:Fungal-type protein kinase domain-containing protein n=1 Tax=Rhodofomes roseus TaxID=34475 RepID=A0ABQ8KF55_9APHY|nr:uncharacterized protein C8Q71DRAFT_907950 [Rhodofomes roseus]KAH9836362.1 hypothetical protein C8Q71DRAFT_907950 [Rhodofomes roseus]
MPRRSKASMLRRPPPRPLSAYPDSSRTACYTVDQADMADKATPHKGPVQPDATDGANKRQKSERDARNWKTEIFERIVEPTSRIHEFLTEFVPSEEPIPACPDETFNAEVPNGKGEEPNMYGPLVDGLTSLFRQFPENRRPEFSDNAHKTVRFPYALCDDAHHATKPDVIATIPALPEVPPHDRWRNIALVFEAKSTAQQDPMMRYTDEHEETLVQLAKSARNIMLAQGRLYAFVVGVYGHGARIFRFDRAGAVCSPLFDYVKEPHILHEFIWRFVNPWTKGCAVVGDDPTTSLGDHVDRAHAQEWVKIHDPTHTYTPEDRKAVRKFVITKDGKNKAAYLAYKLIFVNPRLFSRATTIWEAFELDQDGMATGRRVVIKDAWRQFVRPSEIDFYLGMQEAMDKAEEGVALTLSGIAEFECGDDLGFREAWELDAEAEETSNSDNEKASSESTTRVETEFPSRLRVPCSRVLGHRTVTAGCRKAGDQKNERAQQRLVLKTIGTPITDFMSTYEMVSAVRDAIEGHRQAYLAGVIHRDISQGNVMIVRNADGTTRGFIHDLDYASSWKHFLSSRSKDKPATLSEWEKYAREEYGRDWRNKVPVWDDSDEDSGDELPTVADTVDAESEQHSSNKSEGVHSEGTPARAPSPSKDSKLGQKQRTGTLHFMAIEILNQAFGVTHEARHDLESFYWLLVWIILRHTTFQHEDGDRAWHGLFDAETVRACRALKSDWVTQSYEPLRMQHNPPLEKLLRRFRALCKTNFDDVGLATTCMTHDQVLAIFDRALRNRKAWPKDDRAKPWTPPKRSVLDDPTMSRRSGQARTKGTMTYSSQDERLVSWHYQSNNRPETPPPPSVAESRSDGKPVDSESSSDDDKPITRKYKLGTASGAVSGKQTRTRTAAPPASSESPRIPGGYEATALTDGDSPQRHTSSYSSHASENRGTEDVRQSARSTSRKMGPPPGPSTRSVQSQSQTASRRGDASKRGSSATKRSRERVEDDEVQRGADASRSSKRLRTLSQPRTSRSSHKSKGRR